MIADVVASTTAMAATVAAVAMTIVEAEAETEAAAVVADVVDAAVIAEVVVEATVVAGVVIDTAVVAAVVDVDATVVVVVVTDAVGNTVKAVAVTGRAAITVVDTAESKDEEKAAVGGKNPVDGRSTTGREVGTAERRRRGKRRGGNTDATVVNVVVEVAVGAERIKIEDVVDVAGAIVEVSGTVAAVRRLEKARPRAGKRGLDLNGKY